MLLAVEFAARALGSPRLALVRFMHHTDINLPCHVSPLLRWAKFRDQFIKRLLD